VIRTNNDLSFSRAHLVTFYKLELL